jgi:predicted alpha/beta hydrolase family esterase
MTQVTILVLPGLGGSGPLHWQTLWENQWGYSRVHQKEWDRPDRRAWIEGLDQAISRTSGAVALVAHSLGCALVAHWALRAPRRRVHCALLVAPADVDSERNTPPETRSFAPMPLEPLPFAATVVASRTDPYVDFTRAQYFAEHWGARLIDAGDRGHINAESRLGTWNEGHEILERMLGEAKR